MLTLGACLVAGAVALHQAPQPPSWTEAIATLLGGGGLAVVVIAAVGGGSRLIGATRDREVAARVSPGDALVFGANLLDDAREILADYQVDGSRTRRLPMVATFQADGSGLTIWEGPAADPLRLGFLPRSAIVRVQASRLRIGVFSSRSLHLELDDSRAMDLQPLGSGVLNMFAMTPTDLALLVRMLEEIRTHAVAQGHRGAEQQ